VRAARATQRRETGAPAESNPNDDDDWILLNYGRWPNPTRQDKKGALAISPSIFILTEIAGGVVGPWPNLQIHGIKVTVPEPTVSPWACTADGGWPEARQR
jgi:hypothetical protein